MTRELLYYMMARFYEEGANFLDALLPFIEYCLSKNIPKKISTSIIKQIVEHEFPLDFPLGVYEEILGRMVEKDILSPIPLDGCICYEPKRGFLSNNIDTKKIEYNMCINNISSSFIEYAKGFEQTYTLTKAKEIILKFVLKNIEQILLSSDKITFTNSDDFSDEEKIISSFLVDEYEKNTENIKYLSTIIKGLMCYQFIFYKDKNIDNDLSDLKVFFDSSLIIYALGYSGKLRETMAKEIIKQLKDRKAKLFCFEHTVTEIINILSACENVIEQGKAGYGQGKFTVDYFLSFDNSITRINEAIINLRADIPKKIGIEIFPISLYESKDLTPFIDEVDLKNYLIKEMNIESEEERRIENDAKSITLTAYLRNGNISTDLKNAKAIFVTHNRFLAYCSSKYLKENSHVIQTTMPYSQLSTLLLLTNEIKDPNNLPLTIIVENCYAAIAPSDAQWNEYIQKLNEKYERQEISDKDYIKYRSMRVVRNPLLKHSILKSPLTVVSLDEIQRAEERERKKEIKRILEEERKRSEETIVSLESQNTNLEDKLNEAHYIINRIRNEIPKKINLYFLIGNWILTIITSIGSVISYKKNWVISLSIFISALIGAIASFHPKICSDFRNWCIKKALDNFDKKYTTNPISNIPRSI